MNTINENIKITSNVESNQLSIINFPIFKSELTRNKELRIFGTSDNPWFVGKDIAEILGYRDTKDAIKTHVDIDDKMTWKEFKKSGEVHHLPNNIQDQTILINESGVYSLILRSKLEKAKVFKRWLTSEVLPGIRKHGEYKLTQRMNLIEQEKEQLLLANQQLLLINTQLEESKTQVEEEKQEIEEDLNKTKSDFKKLFKNHQSILKRRQHFNFAKGKCFYIWYDPDSGILKFKVGITGNINDCLQQERRSVPNLKLIYLVYLEENSFLEDAILYKFSKNRMPNHEIVKVSEDILINMTKYIISFYNFAHTEETNLNKYNDVAESFDEIQEYTDTNITTFEDFMSAQQGKEEEKEVDADDSSEEKSDPENKEKIKYKKCTKCGEEKTLDCYSKRTKSPDGLEYNCKDCRSESAKKLKEREKIVVDSKVCTGCDEEKDIDEYYGNAYSLDGHQAECKKCNDSRRRY